MKGTLVPSMLRCVDCHGSLTLHDKDCLTCDSCKRSYTVEAGSWTFLAKGAVDSQMRRWDDRMRLFAQWRRERPVAPPVPPKGPSLLEKFARFTGITSGRTLDIGCASGGILCYFQCDEYWGIDPMPLADGNENIFRAVGERIPFKDHSFDHVLLSQVLDHCIDPRGVIEEVLRVVRPGGEVHVLQYVVDRDRRRFRYLISRVRRLLGMRGKVHSWETKPRLLCLKDVRRLVEDSGALKCLRWDAQMCESQVLLSAKVN